MIDLELCCIVNPVIGTNKVPCYCVHCHRSICEPCSKSYLFSKGEGTGIAWFHHRLCKELCTQDVEWHVAYPRVGSCTAHEWCIANPLKPIYIESEHKGIDSL